MYNPDSSTDRAEMGRRYDAELIPREAEQDWLVSVAITRDYEGSFYGTRAEAKRLAEEYFKRKDHEFSDESITSEVDE